MATFVWLILAWLHTWQDGFCETAKSSGTAQYLAPEITRGFKERHGIAVDWGRLEFLPTNRYMVNRHLRTSTNSKYEIFTRINSGSYNFQDGQTFTSAKMLLRDLYERRSKAVWKRSNHELGWCKSLDWGLVQSQIWWPL